MLNYFIQIDQLKVLGNGPQEEGLKRVSTQSRDGVVVEWRGTSSPSGVSVDTPAPIGNLRCKHPFKSRDIR